MELKKFKKVEFKPNETKIVEFDLEYADLTYYDQEGNVCLEDGKIAVFVGGSSDKTIKKDFHIKIEK